MDIYVVITGNGIVIGASGRLQGAELIRANYNETVTPSQRDTCRIINVELQDTE